MTELFLDCFHHFSSQKVGRYLQSKGVEFKVPLSLDNAPGHPRTLGVLHENVEVMFLPPNTTSFIQPMDQDIIRIFKAHYIRRVMARLHVALDEDPSLGVMQYWKTFSVAECVSVVTESFMEP